MKNTLWVLIAVAVAMAAVVVLGSWIMVRGSRLSPSEQTVLLYYYDQDRDRGVEGQVQCSADGLVPVTRTIGTNGMMRDEVVTETMRMLLQGRISMAEEDAGLVANFPIDGVALNGLTMESGTARLNVADLFGKSSGGSCRVNILRAQITATAMQFDGVDAVVIEPEDIFQP